MPNFSPTSPYMFVDFVGTDGLRDIDVDTARLFHAGLVIEVPKAVDAIINNAKGQLSPGHGYDTGLMKSTLTKNLLTASLSAGVIYELLSDEADYWIYMEDGFTTANGDWIEGYHFFARAIQANRGRMGKAIAKAWRDASVVLAAKAMMPRGVQKLL